MAEAYECECGGGTCKNRLTVRRNGAEKLAELKTRKGEKEEEREIGVLLTPKGLGKLINELLELLQEIK
jgi:hypothetical protein